MTRYFHGTNRTGPYFEGWYFKHQNLRGQTLALIPAFHIDREGRRTASLQIISKDQAWWLEYPASQLHISRRPLQARLGQSGFGEQGIDLHIQQDGLSLQGALRYGSFTPLQSDIMGPFRFFAGMQCSHGIISMGHSLSGTLELNGECLDFSGGTGYIETDRGHSFPSKYLIFGYSPVEFEGLFWQKTIAKPSRQSYNADSKNAKRFLLSAGKKPTDRGGKRF